MPETLTTANGAPVADNQNSLTAGPRGPVLLTDVHLVEKLAHFNRERVPERVVHAKGSGAFGTFTLTNDLSEYTRAKLFQGIGNLGTLSPISAGPGGAVQEVVATLFGDETMLARGDGEAADGGIEFGNVEDHEACSISASSAESVRWFGVAAPAAGTAS